MSGMNIFCVREKPYIFVGNLFLGKFMLMAITSYSQYRHDIKTCMSPMQEICTHVCDI